MESLTIGLLDRSYDIYIGQDILTDTGALVRHVYSGRQAALISDDIVWPLYGKIITDSLQAAGIESFPIVLPHGEQYKSLESLNRVLNELAEQGMTRAGLVVALGGGVIGDLAGFASSIYMRGIDYIQIPTTLLSQVDSSVGGKTAVNLAQGKNLVGTFWQPRLVVIDTLTLETLPDREFAGGMAEVIKYGVLSSPPLFAQLSENPGRAAITPFLPQVIRQCCEIKRGFVEKDERDTGERMLLNLGHTFGHAIEKLGDYTRFIHGEGVALGMVMASCYGEMSGITGSGVTEEIYQLLQAFDLPVDTAIDRRDIIPLVGLDKKASDEFIRLILIRDIGDCFIYTTTPEEFARIMGSI